ncbi:hypothetical protein [Streptomyces sp. NPDC048590]|uniref:hypothetical protein n=1 Tax=Streptomyces sp. NPDC048590 TaxID=3365574 RepID=UPI003711CA26
MSTTRHLVNRRRRLAAVAPATPRAVTDQDPVDQERTTEAAPPAEPDAGTPDIPGQRDAEGKEDPAQGERPRGRLPVPRIPLPAVLCAATVLLGAFAAWSFGSAAELRDDPTRRNTALTDISRTSEVKGQISEAVGAVFSYTYASPGKSDLAVRTYLTGKAVQQHQDMLAEVRAQAPKQKLVLTTTVTETGVELLEGDRARVLVFADQSNTRTGKEEETTYAAAMFAVDAVRRGDTWRIAAIDTFAR